MMKIEQQRARGPRLSLSLKCSAVLLLLSLSVLVMACGTSNNTATTSLGVPQVTVTFHFNDSASPIPTIAPYLCGAWITNTTPAFNPGHQIPVYARFVRNVNGNPTGIRGANARATIEWADGGKNTITGTTGSDGLAVFYFTIPNRPNMVNRNSLVLVSFAGPNGEACNVDNQRQPAAYFTLIPAPQPTPTPQSTPSPLPILPTIQSIQDIIPPGLDLPPGF
jgi:hypothetical protein